MPSCKYCQSENVIKYGKYKDTQYYLCKDCNHRFASDNRIPKMQNSTKTIADALNMYYEGMSLGDMGSKKLIVTKHKMHRASIVPVVTQIKFK